MPPEEPPEGCFWVTIGKPIHPELFGGIRSQGRESLCRYFLKQGLKEQSRYKLLRFFFPMSFRDFKALERQVSTTARVSMYIQRGSPQGKTR